MKNKEPKELKKDVPQKVAETSDSESSEDSDEVI